MSGLPAFHRVRWCGCAGYLGLSSLSWRVPSLLSSLSLCAWCVSPEYGSIWLFKGVFGGFYGVRVGLCGFGALRGLYGFCARVELGGLKACCVFASVFILLCLYFIRFSSSSPIFWGFAFVVLGLSSCIVFVALWVWLLFPFPFRTKRKRAQLFCALSLLGFGVFILSYLR